MSSFWWKKQWLECMMDSVREIFSLKIHFIFQWKMDWNESFCFFLISLAIKHGLNPNCMQAYWTQIIDLKFSSNQYLRQTKHCTDEIHETFNKCILHKIMTLITNSLIWRCIWCTLRDIIKRYGNHILTSFCHIDYTLYF